MSSFPYSLPFRQSAIPIALAACFSAAAGANPTGPVVVGGSATFSQSGKSLNITNSPGAVIQWQGFSIGAGETTRFLQQSASSAVLNRVVGGESSQILGQLLSNGRVYLINPNGVFIGNGAVIDVAGFAASTLRLTDADFLAGKFKLDDIAGAGSIVNQGTIRTAAGGQVYLVAPNVENHGLITSPTGEIILAAGRKVELVSAASPEVRVELAAPSDRVLNVGQAVAEAGRVGIYGSVIRNAGTISASGARVDASGRVFLVAKDITLEQGASVTANGPSGGLVRIDASGGTLESAGTVSATGAAGVGGDITVTGGRVALNAGAQIDASGDAGGGRIRVGGDYHGAASDLTNARTVAIAPDVRISADAVTTGDGGRVVLWSDESTQFAGAISARGGARSGNGGFVEVSGRKTLGFTGRVDTTAVAGETGTLLLDPTDIYIAANQANADAAAGSTVTGNISATTPPNFAEGSGNNRSLLTALGSNNVTVTTTSAGTAQGNITIVDPIAYTGGTNRTLSLTAANAINVNASVTSSTAQLGMTLNAGAGGIAIGSAGNINLAGGLLTLNTAGTSSQNAASVISGTTAVTKSGAGTMTFSGANTYTGLTTVSAGTLAYGTNNVIGSGAVTVSGTGTLALGAFSDSVGAVTVSATAGGITGSGGTLTGTSYSVTNATGSTTISANLAGSAGLTKSGAGTLVLSGLNTYTGATAISGGIVSVNTIGDVGVASALGQPGNATSGTIAIGSGATAGALTYTGAATSTNRIINLAGTTGGATLTSSGTGALTLTSGFTATGAGNKTLTLAATNSGTINGSIVNPGTGATSLTVSGGNWTLAAPNTYTGATTVSGGTLSLGANDVINDASAVTVNGAGTLAMGTFSDTVGAVTVSATSNGISGSGTLTGSSYALTSASGSATISAILGGSGGLTKTGAGTVVLSGANTYTGATTINAGSLSVGTLQNGGLASGIGASGSAASNLILGGGTLLYTGATTSIDRDFTLTNATTSTINVSTTASNLTLSGAAAATSGALTKAGTGTLTLTGANAYTGATNITAGTLSINTLNDIGTASSLGSSGVISIGSTTTAATLQYTGAGSTSNRVINLAGTTGGATLNASGTGALTLTGT